MMWLPRSCSLAWVAPEEAVLVDGEWKISREEIVGTSFLNFQGTPIG